MQRKHIASVFENPFVIVILGFVYIGLIITMLALFAYMYTRQRRYIYDNTTLDNKIAFKSTLGARKFAWVIVDLQFVSMEIQMVLI